MGMIDVMGVDQKSETPPGSALDELQTVDQLFSVSR